jgi:predicted GIY-YIG superfamily endonuclease
MIWHVYQLREPETGAPFYIGCSRNLESAKMRHRYDPASAAWRRPFDMVSMASFADKKSALRAEGDMIRSLPNLINRNQSWGV